MKRWTLPFVLGALGLVALAGAFGVSRATATTSMHRTSTGSQGGSAGCAQVMSDPDAAKAMQPLHAGHVKDMQAWRDRYGTDPKGVEAQTALKTMRREHVREMRATFKRLGIKVPVGLCDVSMMDGTHGIGMMGGADGMMGGPGDLHQQHHGGGSASSSGASNMMGGSTAGGMMGSGTL